MNWEPLWLLVAALLLSSAFFSMTMTALFALAPLRPFQADERKPGAAARLDRLFENPAGLMIALAAAASAAGLAAVMLVLWALSQGGLPLALARALEAFPDLFWPGLILCAALLLIAAEGWPKLLGFYHGAEISRFFTRPAVWFMRAGEPVGLFLQRSSEFLLDAVGGSAEGGSVKILEDGELEELVAAGSREGLLDVTERELLVNLLRSGEVTAGAIMTPRQEIVSVPVTTDWEEARAPAEREGYSRAPVYEGSRENIIGTLTAKSLLLARFSSPSGRPGSLRELIREPLFVPEGRKLRDLLVDFRKSRNHMAMVVDEFGSLVGLVTLEDVLEEIFGEVDEDDDEPDLQSLGDNHWRVYGRMEVSEFNSRIGSDLPEAGARTLAGLMVSLLGRRPRPGDEVKIAGLRFRVLETQGILIHRLEAWREDP